MKHKHRRGQALVEFALVFPIFLLLLFALIDVGRAVFTYNTLTNAAREGARLAIVNQSSGLVSQRTQEIAIGVALSTPPTNVVRFYRQQPNLTSPETNPSCDNSDASHPVTVGCIAIVRAETTWSAMTPIIGSLLGPINLRATAELPIEFVCPDPSIPEFVSANLCPKQP